MQSSMRRLTSSLLLSTFYISLFSCKKTTKPQPLPPPVVVPSADKTIESLTRIMRLYACFDDALKSKKPVNIAFAGF